MFEKPNQQIHFCLHGMGTFLCGVPIFVRVLINTIKMGVYVHSWMLIWCGCLFGVGAYLVWVLTVILIMRPWGMNLSGAPKRGGVGVLESCDISLENMPTSHLTRS